MRTSPILFIMLWLPSSIYAQNNYYKAHKDSGNTALFNEKHLEAIRHYKIAKEDTSLAAQANFNMGIAYQALMDYENAIICYKIALDLYTSPIKKAAVYNSMGSFYKENEQYQQSIKLFKKAIKLDYNPIIIANLANTFLLNNQSDSAVHYFNKSNENQSQQIIFDNTVFFAWNMMELKPNESYKLVLGLNPKSTRSYYLDIYYYLLGRYYNSTSDTLKAKAVFEKGLSVCNNQQIKIDLLGLLGRYKEAVAIIDTLLGSSENYSTKVILASRQAQFYNDLILETMDGQRYDSAFYLAEKSKSVALKAYLNGKGANRYTQVKSIGEIQASLRDNEILFEYKVIDSLMLCFEVSPDSFRFYRTRLTPTFFKAIEDVDSICKVEEFPMPKLIAQYCKGAHYLYETFFGGRNIRGKKLVIVPDGRFYNLSFDALLTSPGDTSDYLFKDMPYLVRQNAVRYVYTASMNHSTDYHDLEILHIAPPVKLAGAQKLRRTIRKYSRFYDRFTKEELEGEMKKHAFLHFDTHGHADKKEPLRSSLSLGTDSLFLSEIIQEDLPHTDMVFLAACNTGVGKYSEGEGSINLERGFMMAGAKTVVSAFWMASDLYAPRIISAYYRELRKGASPEDAMRTAKLEFLDAPTKANRHGYLPFNWATYNVIGASGTVPPPGKRPFATEVAGLSFFLLLLLWIGFLRFKKRNR